MLRPHVQHHLGAVEECLLSCRDFYLMHCVLSALFCVHPRLITTTDAERLDHEPDIFDLAGFPAVDELQHDRARCARLVPDVSWGGSFRNDKSGVLGRFRRVEDFGTVMSGDLFGRHLSFGITSLPPINIWRIMRS